VACGYQGADYAQSLLDLAPQGQMAFAPAVVSSKKGLAGRVRRILQDKCGNPRAGVRWVAIVSVVATFLAVGVAFAQTRPVRTDTTRVVHFPRDRSLGRLMIRDATVKRHIDTFHYWVVNNDSYGFGTEYLGEAKGDVTVPAGKRLALFVNKAAWRDLSPLSELRPNDLYRLILPGSISEPGNPDDRCMPHIAGLTGLKVLNLYGTNISSKGLRYIKDFKKLERLYPPERITNAGLADVAELHSLKGLYFKTNRVTNAGLRHLSKLTSLEELELGGKQIDDAGLVHLAKLKSLNYLVLWGYFSDAGMAHLKDIPNLRILDIGLPGPITDEGLANLAGCTQLERISLHWNENITDKGASYLATMPSLKMIDLWHAHITDAGLAHLAEIKSLEYLDLPRESVTDKGIKFTITDKGVAYLRKLNKLKHLHFNGTSGGGPISDTGLSYLTQLHSLEELMICGKDITDAGMSHIAKLDNLKELSLFGCPISNRGLARLTTLKHLEHLNLSYSETSIAALAHLASAMPNLTNLNVHEMQRGNSVLDISGLTNLKQLAITLKEPSAFSDEDFACIAKLKRLKWLQLWPTKLSNAGMTHLAGLRNIERINIGGPDLTDDGLRHLANIKKLNHLTITDGKITDKGLRHLEGLKALTHLNIKSQNDFSPAALERLRRKLPGLAMLSIGEERGGYGAYGGGRARALNRRSRRSQRDTRNRPRRRRW
jgi:hypothetical protein